MRVAVYAKVELPEGQRFVAAGDEDPVGYPRDGAREHHGYGAVLEGQVEQCDAHATPRKALRTKGLSISVRLSPSSSMTPLAIT